MVAIAGRGWRLAPSLMLLVDECDRLAPRRSTASDGSIGDQSHAARESDHNPEDDRADRDRTRWVTAVDITHDPAHGMDAHGLAEEIRSRCERGIEKRLDYIISRSRIASRSSGWKWRRYGGDNPHDKHAHFSVLNTATGRDGTRSWLTEEAARMALTDQDRTWLRNTIRAECNGAIVEVLRAPEFDVDEASEDLADIFSGIGASRRLSRASLVATLVAGGMSPADAKTEAARIESTANAELGAPVAEILGDIR